MRKYLAVALLSLQTLSFAQSYVRQTKENQIHEYIVAIKSLFEPLSFIYDQFMSSTLNFAIYSVSCFLAVMLLTMIFSRKKKEYKIKNDFGPCSEETFSPYSPMLNPLSRTH